MKRILSIIYCIGLISTIKAQDKEWAIMYAQGDLETIIESATQAIALDSNHLEAYYWRSQIYVQKGLLAAAKNDLEKLVGIDSIHEKGIIALASIYEQQQYLSKASKYYSKLNLLRPDNAYYYRKNARLMALSGADNEAIKLYTKSHELNPKDVITLSELAELWLEEGDLDRAENFINKGLALDIDHIGLSYQLALCKYKQQQFGSVVEILETAGGKVDLNDYHNKMLGFAYLQIDSLDKAIQKLEKSLIKDNSPEKTYYYLSMAYERKGNFVGAQSHLASSIKYAISPDLGLYYRNLARLNDKQGEYKLAIANYQEALKYRDDANIIYYMARACDIYYKDKSIAIKHYDSFAAVQGVNESYKKYAQERSKYLKEISHQAK